MAVFNYRRLVPLTLSSPYLPRVLGYVGGVAEVNGSTDVCTIANVKTTAFWATTEQVTQDYTFLRRGDVIQIQCTDGAISVEVQTVNGEGLATVVWLSQNATS